MHFHRRIVCDVAAIQLGHVGRSRASRIRTHWGFSGFQCSSLIHQQNVKSSFTTSVNIRSSSRPLAWQFRPHHPSNDIVITLLLLVCLHPSLASLALSAKHFKCGSSLMCSFLILSTRVALKRNLYFYPCPASSHAYCPFQTTQHCCISSMLTIKFYDETHF